MARSKIISDLVNEKISLNVALNQLLVITHELGNEDLNHWIKCELNGYGNYDEIPEYRKNLPAQIVYTGINGRLQATNQPLSLSCFGEHAKFVEERNSVQNSIVELMSDSDGTMMIDLTLFAGEVFKNTGIQCVSISLRFGNNIKPMIASNVKTKVLESLLLLDKEFGNLDELYIEEESRKDKKVDKVNKDLRAIVFADGKEF